MFIKTLSAGMRYLTFEFFCWVRHVDDGGVSIGVHTLYRTLTVQLGFGRGILKYRRQLREDILACHQANSLHFFSFWGWFCKKWGICNTNYINTRVKQPGLIYWIAIKGFFLSQHKNFLLKHVLENVVYTMAAILSRPQCDIINTRRLYRWQTDIRTIFNSWWPGDAIWWLRSGSTLVQVMACCMTAASHYLNQCWLITSKVQWHSNFTRETTAINH